MVCSITCGPANPARAPGSASTTSPRLANEALTPPNVGSHSTDRYGTPAPASRRTAAAVLATCSSAKMPSCIRAPPEAEQTTRGVRVASASSAARHTFSPTTEPIDPPMNAKSRTASTTGKPATVPVP